MGFLAKVVGLILGALGFFVACLIWGFWPVAITIGIGWACFALLTHFPLAIIGIVVAGGAFLIHLSHPRVVGSSGMMLAFLAAAGLIWLQFKTKTSSSSGKSK